MTARDIVTRDWLAALTATGPIGIGHDIATTTKGTSNWSSVTVTQHASPSYVQALVLRWRTDAPAWSIDILDEVISAIESTQRRPKRLVVDASNETFHAKNIATHFRGRVPVELVKGGEKIVWKNESFDAKTLLGNLYVAAFEDNLMAMPEGKWIQEDHRLVRTEAGRFVAEIGPDGGHGDTFDSGKLAYWALMRRTEAGAGSVQAAGVGGGFGGGAKPQRAGIIGPLMGLFRPRGPGRMA